MSANTPQPSLIESVDGWDIAEGLASGGIVGTVVYVIGGAVATLPAPFITAPIVGVLATIAGALTFASIVIHNARHP
jgi:hypothetical protein